MMIKFLGIYCSTKYIDKISRTKSLTFLELRTGLIRCTAYHVKEGKANSGNRKGE